MFKGVLVLKGTRKSIALTTIVLPVLLACGIISYVVGLFGGFIEWCGVFVLLLGGEPFTLFVSPSWFFAVYPMFSLTFLQDALIPSFGLSPLSFCFLVFVGLSLVFVCFRRLLEGSLFAFSAIILGGIQFIFISSITGFSPLGTSLTALAPNYALPLYCLIFLQKNVVPLLASEAFLGVGMVVCLRRIYLRTKSLLRRVEAPSLEHFRMLKVTNTGFTLFIIPFLIFVVSFIYYWLLFRVEFPNYYLFIDLLNRYNEFRASLLVFESLWVFWFIAISQVFSRITKFLAESYTPLVEKKLKEKPILLVDEIKRSLGVEKADERQFKELLNKVCSISEKESSPIGIYKDYLYEKKFLIQRVGKEIRKQGQADLYKVASEALVPPEILTGIYSLLILEGAIRGVKVTGEGLIIKTLEPRYWWSGI